MPTPRSIVVGTDGSERAERAVDRAGEIASALGAKVHVVSGYGGHSSGVVMVAPRLVTPAEGQEGNVNRTRAQNYVDRAQHRLARLGVESETHVWPEEPADALMRIAEEQGAELIVVGNRGLTGVRRVLGSVPNSVSHHAQCDVLIVKTD